MRVRRPNVLFLICDDLNLALEGWAGHPQAKSPNVTRLTANGTAFRNAHCNAPICAPSRASLWSGLQPHSSGNYTFNDWRRNAVLQDAVMMPSHFRRHGYSVYGTGKLFHNGHEEPTLYDAYGYEASFGPFPWDGMADTEMLEHPQMSWLFDSHEQMPLRWEHSFGPLSERPVWPEGHAVGCEAGWRLYNRPFRYVDDDDRDLLPDELSTDWAIARLRETGNRPFFIAVGFNRPHTPLYVPDRYFDAIPLDDIELPTQRAFPDDAPAITRYLYAYGIARYRLYEDAGGDDLLRRWIQAYLASVLFVDDQIGRLMDALAETGHADDTIVIFTSDNGYHLGEKGVLFKNTLWDQATHVPLVMAGPRVRRGGEVTTAVSLVDLYPTLADLCGLDASPNAAGAGPALDGRSLRPWLEGGADESHPVLTAMATNEAVRRALGDRVGPAHFTVRDDRWRYTRFGDGEEQLYDHDADAEELDDLAAAPGLAQQKARLREQLQAAGPDWIGSEGDLDWGPDGWTI